MKDIERFINQQDEARQFNKLIEKLLTRYDTQEVINFACGYIYVRSGWSSTPLEEGSFSPGVEELI